MTLPFLPDPLILPPTTLSGVGRIHSLFDAVQHWGPHGLLVVGQSAVKSGLAATLTKLAPPGISLDLSVHAGGEPTLYQLDQLLQSVRSLKIDWIAAVGGGSVLDLAKAAAGLAHARHSPAAYFDGTPIEVDPLPFLAAPTTAGTGSEATVNAVLIHPGDRRKKSIRDSRWMPRYVILDPNLLIGCPAPVIADSGMDALTQAIEAYTSRYASRFSDSVALESIALLHRYLPPVYTGPATDADRFGLLSGSYLGGLVLSMARLGVVHGIAHPLGSLFNIPHGRICALCLPLALEMNRTALGEKYDRLSSVLEGDAISVVRCHLSDFAIRSPLKGVDIADSLEFIVKETLASGSCQANCKTISRADVLTLLRGLGCRLPRAGSARTPMGRDGRSATAPASEESVVAATDGRGDSSGEDMPVVRRGQQSAVEGPPPPPRRCLMKIVVACGGSGGHTFPGLATARELRAQGHEVTLWLAGQQIENTVASAWNGPVQTIPAQGFGGNPVRKLVALLKMFRAVLRCYFLFGKERPDRLLAMGSYSSVGPVIAARCRRIPVVLHESNAIPGKATLFLSHFAQAIAVNFDSCRHHLSHPDIIVTGMPLRSGFDSLPPTPLKKTDAGLILLAMGGSQGAHRLNEAVRDAVIALHRKGYPIFVIHLAGLQDADPLKSAYAQAGVPHEVHAFYQDMPLLYARANLAISRAGAASCAELLACGLPALLIPYPEAARDHQTANARSLTEAGAAVWIPQAQATPERLVEFIENMALKPERYASLREAALRLAIPDGAVRLAALVLATRA